MRLGKKIKKFLKHYDICYPSDFFWLNTDNVKERWKEKKLATVAVLICYFIWATIAFIGYYLSLPLGILNKWCAEWCYK